MVSTTIIHGWKSAGITETILVGTKDSPSLDPFTSINSLDEAPTDFTVITAADNDIESFATPKESYLSGSQNEWGPDNETENFEEEHGNIFEVLDDKDDI